MTEHKILNLDQLLIQTTKWKADKKQIVFTNGCFDIIHLGHVDYLEKARHKGDVLVVGLNSDGSVRRIKGAERPVFDEHTRSRLLAAMAFVDAVIIFEDETPYQLIKTIKPDILIKGKDYSISNIVGADLVLNNGGKVLTIDLVEGYSSSKIINKIKRL